MSENILEVGEVQRGRTKTRKDLYKSHTSPCSRFLHRWRDLWSCSIPPRHKRLRETRSVGTDIRYFFPFLVEEERNILENSVSVVSSYCDTKHQPPKHYFYEGYK